MGNNAHHGHVTDTECRPDFTAAFDKHWGDKNTTLWPASNSPVETRSKESRRKIRRSRLSSYLHYLLAGCAAVARLGKQGYVYFFYFFIFIFISMDLRATSKLSTKTHG
jgi:hypothetical protein